MHGRFLFLGTGGSMGIPVIGCTCSVCTSSSPFDKRMRSSGLVTLEDKRFLIDVGPEFRQQALKHQIHHLDGVLITHAHADHIVGMDDLKAYYYLNNKKKLPCLLSADTLHEVKMRFYYLIDQLEIHTLEEDFGTTSFVGTPVQYMSYFQSEMKVTGFRFGNFAYVSDIRRYTDEIFLALTGVEILVLSALRHVSTAMHFSIEEAIAFSRRTGAKTTYFTHIAHDIAYAETSANLPPHFRLAYDGLEVDIEL